MPCGPVCQAETVARQPPPVNIHPRVFQTWMIDCVPLAHKDTIQPCFMINFGTLYLVSPLVFLDSPR